MVADAVASRSLPFVFVTTGRLLDARRLLAV
jgi:hypothetical protein